MVVVVVGCLSAQESDQVFAPNVALALLGPRQKVLVAALVARLEAQLAHPPLGL